MLKHSTLLNIHNNCIHEASALLTY